MALIKIVLNSVKNRLIGRVTGGAAIGTIRFFGVVANSTFKGVAMRSGMHNTLHKQLLRQLSTTPRSEVEALKQTALEYDRISKATLESLSDALDNLAESKEGHDLEYSVSSLPPPPCTLVFISVLHSFSSPHHCFLFFPNCLHSCNL